MFMKNNFRQNASRETSFIVTMIFVIVKALVDPVSSNMKILKIRLLSCQKISSFSVDLFFFALF